VRLGLLWLRAGHAVGAGAKSCCCSRSCICVVANATQPGCLGCTEVLCEAGPGGSKGGGLEDALRILGRPGNGIGAVHGGASDA
jgi:hypothetical protein